MGLSGSPSVEAKRTRCQAAEASSVLAGCSHSASCLRFGVSSVSSVFSELNSDSSSSRIKECEASCGHLELWSWICGLPSGEDTVQDLGPEPLPSDSGQLGSSEEAWLPQWAKVQGMGSWKQPASFSPPFWEIRGSWGQEGSSACWSLNMGGVRSERLWGVCEPQGCVGCVVVAGLGSTPKLSDSWINLWFTEGALGEPGLSPSSREVSTSSSGGTVGTPSVDPKAKQGCSL